MARGVGRGCIDTKEGTEVGFDANRRYRDDKSNDIWILVSAVVLLVGAVLWAIGVF